MAPQLQRDVISRKSMKPSTATVSNPLGLKLKLDQPTKLSFGQDFVFEHCMPVPTVTSALANGEAVNPFGDLQNSPQSFGFPC